MSDALTNLDRLAEMWADLDPVDDWRPHIRDAIEEIIRLRAALAAPPVGWVLVPVEPTLAMGWAYLDAANENEPLRRHLFNWAGYRAMLAAAPGAPDARHKGAQPVAWWIPKAEQFCIATPGERPFAKAWEPLYSAPITAKTQDGQP